MRRKEHYWSLFHTTEKNQLNDLRTDQVEAIFAAIPKAQRREWLIWKEGMENWKQFEEFPQLLIGLRNQKSEESVQPPTPPGAKEVVRVIEATSIGGVDELAIDDEETNGEDRVTPRYNKRFDIRAHIGDRVFQSSTVNISMTGMRLRDPVPQGAPKYFNVEIRAGDKVLPVLCSVIKTTNGAPSSRLKIESNDHVNLLQTLLLST